jgi:methyltransferase (TIGR00027 family)
VLGAGMDTFAYRNPLPADRLRVFEVDFPSTQAWKRERLADAGIAVPVSLTFAPIDFESTMISAGLRDAGFDAGAPAFFSWLGVVPYLTENTIVATLQFVAGLPTGTGIVFDYGVPPSTLTGTTRLAYEAMAERVESAGEPFRTFFEPDALGIRVRALGFSSVDDEDAGAINRRYFEGRPDNLRVSGIGHLLHAIV